MVHSSQGVVSSDIAEMRSEPAIIAGIAQATLGAEPVDWLALASNYDLIRDAIAQTLPGFQQMNERLKQPGGFYLGNSAAKYQWHTTNQKANFHAHPLPEDIVPASIRALSDNRIFVLQTLRSHDQYNTTIYGFEDRYRGVSGERNIVFMNQQDITDLGFLPEQKVDVTSLWPDEKVRKIFAFKLVPYEIPQGNIAAYFPEANALVPLASSGDFSDTPTSKSIAVIITATEQQKNII